MKIKSLVLMALLSYVIISCQKDSVSIPSFSATLENCTENYSKTILVGTSMTWVNGDQIKVIGTSEGVYEAITSGTENVMFNVISGDAGRGPYRAYYPASLFSEEEGCLCLPVIQASEDGSLTEFPMYAESNNNELSFKNICGILRLRLKKTGLHVKSIQIACDIPISGSFQLNYNNELPQITPCTSSGSYSPTRYQTMITCTSPQNITSQKDFYLHLPPHTYENISIRIFSSDGRVCTKTVSTGHSVSIQRSKITTISLSDNNLSFVPEEGALSGVFSMGHDFKVQFSKGNLQYQASSQTWRFAEHQYDFVGNVSLGNVYENGVKCNNAYISSTYSGWIDLFGCGTATNPTLTSNDAHDYENHRVDWGLNAISNGGNIPNLWFTPSWSHWYYLLHYRPNAAEKYGVGNIEGTANGLIILPDNWSLPSGLTFNPGVSSDYRDWTTNSYTQTQWEAMEAAGAVFLPAAGIRWYTNRVYTVGERGVYNTPDTPYDLWGSHYDVNGNLIRNYHVGYMVSVGVLYFYSNRIWTLEPGSSSLDASIGKCVRLAKIAY